MHWLYMHIGYMYLAPGAFGGDTAAFGRTFAFTVIQS